MSDLKFTVSNGQWTISYEGSEEFLNDGLISTVQRLLDSGLFTVTSASPLPISQPENQYSPQHEGNGANAGIPQMTINNLCAKLDCKTGPDLVIAACVYMTFMEGKDLLARRDILQTMKSATRYFKDTYASNLSASLSTLVKADRLRERSDDVYLLSPSFVREMEAALA